MKSTDAQVEVMLATANTSGYLGECSFFHGELFHSPHFTHEGRGSETLPVLLDLGLCPCICKTETIRISSSQAS